MSSFSFIERIKSQLLSTLHINEEWVTCAPHDSVQRVAEILAEKKVGSIVIVDPTEGHNRPLGIFTERDLIRCVANRKLDLSQEPISKHMTPQPKTASLTVSLMHVMAMMRMGKFRHLVIVNESGGLAGVVSIRDIMVHLLDEINEFK